MILRDTYIINKQICKIKLLITFDNGMILK